VIVEGGELVMAQPQAKSSEPQAVRIARLMGLADADAMTDAKLARVVCVGVPVTAIRAKPLGRGLKKDASQISGLTATRLPKGSVVVVGSVLNTKAIASKILSREESERLYEISRVMDAALRAFDNDRTVAEAFLSRPHPLLDGEVPLELAQVSSAGADAVVALIGRAVAGVAI
jgi:putative toxin-antitoxin system antitoxin component (TIGR02293 family)